MSTAALSFDAVHRTFAPKVLRYLAGFVDVDEAADLAQVTMLKVSEHLGEFRGDSSLATWIYRIARNVALDRLRQRSPELVPVETVDDGDESVAEDSVPQLQSPSAHVTAERDEMSGCLRDFIDRLPESYRRVLLLSEIGGFTSAEIAETLGTSVETVKMRLHRARGRLRADLSAGCDLGHDERSEVACDRRQPIRLK